MASDLAIMILPRALVRAEMTSPSSSITLGIIKIENMTMIQGSSKSKNHHLVGVLSVLRLRATRATRDCMWCLGMTRMDPFPSSGTTISTASPAFS